MRLDDTKNALDRYRDDERFEELASRLLAQDVPLLRPLGGRGDRARDAVGGLYRLGTGEELVVMYSLRRDWDTKIAEELRRIGEFGWDPKDVIAVTNRALDRDKERMLQEKAEAEGWALTIYGQEWLAIKLHLRDNLDLRTEYLGLARPEPELFMLAQDFGLLLGERGRLPVGFVGRERDLRAGLDRLSPAAANLHVEADGGLGKTRLVYEMSQRERRERRWFFVPEGLPFQPSRLSDLESGDEIVVVIDDAHRRPDLRALLAGLERRVPRPQIVLITRPGYDDVIDQSRRALAFDRPEKVRLSRLTRKDIVSILRQPPLGLEHEGALLSIVQLSDGNPQIAIIVGKLAASGRAPHDLGDRNVFREYVASVLDAAPAAAPAAREVLALIAAVRTIDLGSARDVAHATALTGLNSSDLRRRLVALADSGLVVEQSSRTFAIKPDLLSEEILRYSFFGEKRPALAYAAVYEAFAPHRLGDLLWALSEARIASVPEAAETLRMVRNDLVPEVPIAPLRALAGYARFARASAGIPDVSLALADALIARLPELAGGEFASVASDLVGAASRAKFADLPRGFRTLLNLGLILFADGGDETAARDALEKDISEIYSTCPVDYSDNDWRILAGTQTVVLDEAERFWHAHETNQAGVVTAAIAARALLTLAYEHIRPAADDAMAIRMYGVGVPATPLTRAALTLGARLFVETFLRLPAKLQLKQLSALREIANAAAGVSGFGDLQHGADVQAMADELLSTVIEAWLRKNLAAIPVPVAAEVLAYFQDRVQAERPSHLRVSARLREYVDLIHPGTRRWGVRRTLEADEELVRSHAEKYARRLLGAEDPLTLIDRWNAWLDEAKLTLDRSTWHHTLLLTLAEVGKRDAGRGSVIAKHIYETNISMSRYGNWLLEAIAPAPEGRSLITAWVDRPEPYLRCAAAVGAVALDAEESEPLLTRLASDQDPSVRAAVWDGLYRLREPLSEWQLDIALELSREPSTDGRLNLLLSRLAHQAKRGTDDFVMTDLHRAAIAELVLVTAQTEQEPDRGTSDLLEYASQLGLELVGDWIWHRIEHLRGPAGRDVYFGDLPDDLGPLVKARRGEPNSEDALARLFAIYEDNNLPGPARQATQQAIGWYADDTPELTAQMIRWSSQGEEGLARATMFLAHTRQWDLFTERARQLLQTAPHDPHLRAKIIGARRPLSFRGSGELQYRAEAEQFATWLEADDALIVATGRQAVDQYNKLADQAAHDEERDRQGFAD